MSKPEIFKFKQFAVEHSASAIPVGFDAVLLGAWTDVSEAKTILDAGTGCGVIALICAQRNLKADIIGIDIHENSVIEATTNFNKSAWASRLKANLLEFNSLTINRLVNKGWGSGIDLIISNPPFFDSGLKPSLGVGMTESDVESSRLAARHIDRFGPIQLIEHGSELLSPTGSISLICPSELEREIIAVSQRNGLFVRKICRVANKETSRPKRILVQSSRQFGDCVIDNLIIRNSDGTYTSDYRKLTQSLYLTL